MPDARLTAFSEQAVLHWWVTVFTISISLSRGSQAAQADWAQGVKEDYDISKTLTTVQSRIEALMQIGITINTASSDQIRKIVEANK